MRIIAGKHRGRVLAAFGGQDIRPTPDRVKESLFQILSGYLRGARVLDLFAGSGALGLECLSRGAEEAVFNDSSRESLVVLRKNLAACGERAEVLNMDFAACLKSVGGTFDLIFCDPPYRLDLADEIMELVAGRELLREGGLIVYESEREIAAPAPFEIADRREYGRVKIFLLKRRES